MKTILLRKIWREFWGQRARSLLVILSLAVGLFAVGATGGAQGILNKEMMANMQAVHAADMLISTSEVTPAQLKALQALPEVALLEGRSALALRVAVVGEGGTLTWRNLTLYAVPNYAAWTLDLVRPLEGTWPPTDNTLVLERGTLAFLSVQPGEMLRLQNPHGQMNELLITGVGHDLYQVNPTITAGGAGYVTAATLQMLGGPEGFTDLHLQLYPETISHQVEKKIRQALESQGVNILALEVLASGAHPLAGMVQGITWVLGLMGGLALALSGFLMVNTINALLLEQTRQIGILKALGARRGQIIGMYLTLVGLMGSVALIVAIPLGGLGAHALSGLIANLLNLDLQGFGPPTWVYILQGGLGLFIPGLAALFPILSGARMTVRAALTSYGLGNTLFGQGRLDQLTLGKSVSLRMAIRNALRRKQRLALTLTTLILASAIAISVFSVQAATQKTLRDLRTFFRHDLYIQFNQPVEAKPMLEAVTQTSGVSRAEAWAIASAYLPSDAKDEPLALWAIPPDTAMLAPQLVAGRWLEAQDGNVIVIDTHLLRDYPHLQIGDMLTLTLQGKSTEWLIVGIFQTVPNRIRPTAMAYVPYEAYTFRTHTQGLANQVWVQGHLHDAAGQQSLMTTLDQRLKSLGLASDWAVTGEELNTSFATAFNILSAFLLGMAGLLGVVGGLGLMGMLSLNVLERKREVGMLRALGAGSGMIRRILRTESLFIAGLAWGISTLLAWPLSNGMCVLVGQAILNAPFAQTFSLGGALIWLAVIIFLALLSSWLPARRAMRLPVAEVLAYE